MKRRPFYRWTVVVAYVALIYLTVPYVPTVWIRMRAHLGVSYDAMALYPLLAAAAAAATFGIYRTRGEWRTLLGMSVAGCAYVYLYRYSFQAPAERLHLLEYGVLPMLIYWAQAERVPPTSYLLPPAFCRLPPIFCLSWVRLATGAAVLSFVVGAVDELLQHYTPGRFGELRDVAVNWESSLLGLALLLLVKKPWRPGPAAAA